MAIYLGLLGVLKTANPQTTPIVTVQWVVFFVILVLTIPWQRKIVKTEPWNPRAAQKLKAESWKLETGNWKLKPPSCGIHIQCPHPPSAPTA